MHNLSQAIKDTGLEEGITKGIAEGITKGVSLGIKRGKAEERLSLTLRYVMKLMQVANISAEEVMNLLDVDENMRPIILKSIK